MIDLAHAIHPDLNLFFVTVAGTAGLLCGGRVVSIAIQRHRRRKWAAQQTDMRALRSMTWRDFETLTAELFRGRGYAVKETGGGGPDGGIDLILRKSGRKYLVQCKHYRKSSVGAPIVRELAGVAVREKAHGVIVVTVGKFTPAAREFAAGLPVELIDGPALLRMQK